MKKLGKQVHLIRGEERFPRSGEGGVHFAGELFYPKKFTKRENTMKTRTKRFIEDISAI